MKCVDITEKDKTNSYWGKKTKQVYLVLSLNLISTTVLKQPAKVNKI